VRARARARFLRASLRGFHALAYATACVVFRRRFPSCLPLDTPTFRNLSETTTRRAKRYALPWKKKQQADAEAAITETAMLYLSCISPLPQGFAAIRQDLPAQAADNKNPEIISDSRLARISPRLSPCLLPATSVLYSPIFDRT